MLKITIQTHPNQTPLELTISQTLLNCALRATLAVIPDWIATFTTCLTQRPPSDYNPGNRKRCPHEQNNTDQP